MIPITRKELYLNKIVGNDDYDIPEKPITTEEFFFVEILGEAVQAPEPLTRYQIYLAKIAGKNIEIPYPETRLEYFLARAAGMDVNAPTPVTREEMFWDMYTAVKEIIGTLPLTFKAKKAGTLENYRIYGNTVGGESVGDRTVNLWDGIEPFSNADTDTKMQLDIWFRLYPASASSPSVSAASAANNAQIGQHIIRTITPQEGYERLVVKHNGSSKDIILISKILEVEKTYIVSFDITKNDVQTVSGVIISNIQIEENSQATDYEPYGYKVPVTISNGTDTLTTPIYLPEQIKMVGDEAEYIDYAEQKQYVETTDGQEKYVVGLNVDFENKTFTRLADAVDLSKGADFDNFSAFGGRRRCNVADNGTITAYHGDANYTEDGSNGQVMVYQPAFYYKVEPLKTEAQESGVGYHLRNVNYYISNYQGEGYKLHPAFYNEAGDRVDYILLGAYEGCIYDASTNAYVTDDSQVLNTSEDKFSSIANVKPASGLSQSLTRPNLETICKNRGNGWHSLNIRIASMEQLLMIIEFGTMNTQAGAGSNGIVFITDNYSYNCASLTGSTGSLGNTSGQAISTISDINGVQTVETANGKTAYSFRGDENPWGNIWKWVDGMNEQNPDPFAAGDRGTLYVADGTGAAPYEDTGIHPAYMAWGSYTSAFGYSEGYDWLFIPTEAIGNSSLPVGDSFSNQNTGWRVAALGGRWNYGASAGAFGLTLINNTSFHVRTIGGRLVYIPQIAKQHIYTTDLDVALPALPTLPGTNVLSVRTAVQPSKVYVKYKGERQ